MKENFVDIILSPSLLLSLLLTLTLPLLAACGPKATPTPAPTEGAATPTPESTPTPVAQPTPASFIIVAAAPRPFAAYQPVSVRVEARVPVYDFDLEAVANPDVLSRLTPAQQTLLEQNGFVVVPRGVPQVYQIYQWLKDEGQPAFVTTDALLHAFHILYDFTLRDVEYNFFVKDLEGLNTAMLQAAQAQYTAATDEKVREAARLNMAFFAVATRLLTPEAGVPAEVADLVEAELALIDAHAGFAPSPIFGYREDYSQYVPRGHYTRNETFQRYFRAMMWYGRMMFRLAPGTGAEAQEIGRRETRQAILITLAMSNAQVGDEPALEVWERIYGPTVFYVGRTDDLNVYDYLEVLRQVYGERVTLADLADDAQVDAFIEKAMTLRPPRIVSSFVTDQEQPEVVTKGFRFMGQRFVPDSYIFQQLVYDKVGTQEKPRLFPKGLDIPAVLGSQEAYRILDEVYQETSYHRYEEQLRKLQEEFAALPPEQWTENLYWGWLHSLRPLLEPAGEGYPPFMQGTAWVRKDLHTFLGSWAELRHDTILYAKQSYTLKATGLLPEEKLPKGYVEPRPEVYARLGALARQLRDGLQERGLLREEFAAKLNTLEKLLLDLKSMAEKELRGEPLSDEEYGIIRRMGSYLEGLTTFSVEVEGQLTSEADQRMAIVADVHTDVNTGQVLEVAVGDAFPIFVIVPVEGELVVAQGGVFSYYEFTHPMSDRLTDEKWQAMLDQGTAPPQPEWVDFVGGD